MNDATEKLNEETLRKLTDQKANILIVGATGSGKSSTINALFDGERAKVGTGATPETKELKKYTLGNLNVWDSPGLGEGVEADQRHAAEIQRLLSDQNEVIDAVLVVLNGGSRDLGTSNELINNVIKPCLGSDAEKRLVIGINKADCVNDGDGWNESAHRPEGELASVLKATEESVQRRIAETTGISVQPVSYSAGYKEEGQPQAPSYNVLRLLNTVIDAIPPEKRIPVLRNVNQNVEMWKRNEGDVSRYVLGIVESLQNNPMITDGKDDFSKMLRDFKDGATFGATIGSFILPGVGTTIGALLGGFGSMIIGLFD